MSDVTTCNSEKWVSDRIFGSSGKLQNANLKKKMFFSLAFPFPILRFCCTFYTHAPTHTHTIKDISFSRVCACVVPHSSASGHGFFESSCKLSPKRLPRLTPAALLHTFSSSTTCCLRYVGQTDTIRSLTCNPECV